MYSLFILKDQISEGKNDEITTKKNLDYGNSNEKVCVNSMYAIKLKSLHNLKNYHES